MAYRLDTNKLYDQHNGYYKDRDGSIYNSRGYRISESQKSINARRKREEAAERQRRADAKIWSDAFISAQQDMHKDFSSLLWVAGRLFIFWFKLLAFGIVAFVIFNFFSQLL